MALIMTQLALRLSAFFPVFEIKLALPAAVKLALPEIWPSLAQRKKWLNRATDGITPRYASQ